MALAVRLRHIDMAVNPLFAALNLKERKPSSNLVPPRKPVYYLETKHFNKRRTEYIDGLQKKIDQASADFDRFTINESKAATFEIRVAARGKARDARELLDALQIELEDALTGKSVGPEIEHVVLTDQQKKDKLREYYDKQLRKVKRPFTSKLELMFKFKTVTEGQFKAGKKYIDMSKTNLEEFARVRENIVDEYLKILDKFLLENISFADMTNGFTGSKRAARAKAKLLLGLTRLRKFWGIPE